MKNTYTIEPIWNLVHKNPANDDVLNNCQKLVQTVL